ncbi:lipase family protein [Lactococcus allomyrinae]|uniref:DUF2974 domain-containing protein n=1 Tax=Lactococcus allomyrinae TaxID=2419773 RepID=A0A387BCW7_9LACT|nr:hypothetical protein [Lactococcus allomyrinae]AYF99871.1 hypothetical protein D7I46_01490 [Lactococcus allomyrinae]
MTTPKQYSQLDNLVYKVDVSKENPPKRKGDSITVSGQKYLVLKTVDSNDPKNSEGYDKNGFQGMAVAPITKTIDGVKVDFSHTIIAYAGTNNKDAKDINTDANNVFFGSKEFGVRTGLNSSVHGDSQFSSAQKFYQEVSKMPDVKVVSTTGHSLGGALAQKVAAAYHLSSVTFSTAGVSSQLTAEEKLWASGAGKDLLLNFVHSDDLVPMLSNAKAYGTWLAAGVFGDNSILGRHNLDSYRFDSDGNVKDQSGAPIFSPKMLKAIKSSYKKVVAPKIKELKTVLASGGVSGSAKIALETELVAYTAKALRAKALNWYENSIQDLEKIQKNYQTKEQEMIQSCKNAGGPLMSHAEAKSIYHSIAGYRAYEASEFKDVQAQLKRAYKRQLKVAENMESLVSKTLENDQSLSQYFR